MEYNYCLQKLKENKPASKEMRRNLDYWLFITICRLIFRKVCVPTKYAFKNCNLNIGFSFSSNLD